MLTTNLYAAAEKGAEAIKAAFNADQARFVKKSIRKAKKAMQFKAIPAMEEYLKSLGVVPVGKVEKSADLTKYPSRLKVTINTGNTEVNGLIVGTVNRLGIIASQESTKNGEVIICNMKTDDAKLLMERAKDHDGFTIEKLAAAKK